MDHEIVLTKLRAFCADRTQRAAATELGISQAYLSDILTGRRAINDHVGLQFGYKRVWTKSNKENQDE
jgi:plasmid maintenance system antidote protein VapI